MSCFAEERNLDHGYLLSILDYDRDTGRFTWKTHRGKCVPGDIAGSSHPGGYWVICIDHLKYLAHRLAWFYVTRTWPDEEIDHRDRNRRNNAFENLRQATRNQNACNHKRRRDNKSGVRGVDWRECKGKWRAHIQHNGRSHHLGYFDSIEDAAEARSAAALRMFGDFAGEVSDDNLRQ